MHRTVRSNLNLYRNVTSPWFVYEVNVIPFNRNFPRNTSNRLKQFQTLKPKIKSSRTDQNPSIHLSVPWPNVHFLIAHSGSFPYRIAFAIFKVRKGDDDKSRLTPSPPRTLPLPSSSGFWHLPVRERGLLIIRKTGFPWPSRTINSPTYAFANDHIS